MARKITAHLLRIRPDDRSEWSDFEYYKSKRDRDKVEQINRIIGGMRTHTGTEKVDPEQVEWSEVP